MQTGITNGTSLGCRNNRPEIQDGPALRTDGNTPSTPLSSVRAVQPSSDGVFGADFSVQNEGWAIDDLCIENVTGPCELTVVEKAPAALKIQLWPNPTSQQSTLNIELDRVEYIGWDILNGLGEVVLNGGLEGQKGRNEILMDIRHLASGMYYVDVQIGEHHTMRKLLITR